MKVEFNWCSGDDMLLGFMAATGQDEDGEFKMLSIGIAFCTISFYWY